MAVAAAGMAAAAVAGMAAVARLFLTAALFVGATAPALAQQLPSYAVPAPPPTPEQKPSYAVNEEFVAGRIASIPGKYDIEVRDNRGFIDRIRLRDGTIITPTGLKLAVGMSVRVFGTNKGEVFEARQIDTSYSVYGYPYYGYGYYGYAYRGWW